MHDYQATAKFLDASEKQEIVLRLEHDRSALSDVFDLKFMKDAFNDWKIWVHMFITIGEFILSLDVWISIKVFY